jgi:catechol 2,3-dioxygenase
MAYRLISQLAHVEILSPKPDETVQFFNELLGLEVSARQGQSVYLRCWAESFHHSLKVTESQLPGLGHMTFRADGPEELDQAASAIEGRGLGSGWIDGDLGHGRAFRFRTPAGHVAELIWEVERYQAPEHLKSTFPNRAQRYPGRNTPLRRIDHVTVTAKDVTATRQFFCEALKFRYMEGTVLPNGTELFAAITSGAHNHDVAIASEKPGSPAEGRLHHVAFYHDTRDEVLRTVDILAEHGYGLEYGPGRHGIGEPFFSYVREPGGNRIELYSGGYLNYEPDWKPVLWRAGEQRSVNAWTVDQMGPPSYLGYATPPLPTESEVALAQSR